MARNAANGGQMSHFVTARLDGLVRDHAILLGAGKPVLLANSLAALISRGKFIFAASVNFPVALISFSAIYIAPTPIVSMW